MTRKNLAYFSLSNTPGTSGNLTVSTAVDALHVTLGASDDAGVFTCRIFEPGLGSEVRTGCTYTHGTTTLTRGTLESSTTGSALNFTSAAKVQVVSSAMDFDDLDRLKKAVLPGGRLTTESGVPVIVTDRTAQSTLYYTPFVHDQIVLWDGIDWTPTTFAETSIALSGLTSARPYDVFAYLSSGSLALELLAWTSDSARATAVTIQDGRYCKSGDKTRLLLGTFYTTSATATEDSVANRYVANHYNKIPMPLSHTTNDAGHTYTGATRAYNNSTTHRVSFVTSVAAAFDGAAAAVLSNTTPPNAADLFMGYDSPSVNSDLFTACSNLGSSSVRGALVGFGNAAPGKHFLQLLERASVGTGNFSFALLRANVEC